MSAIVYLFCTLIPAEAATLAHSRETKENQIITPFFLICQKEDGKKSRKQYVIIDKKKYLDRQEAFLNITRRLEKCRRREGRIQMISGIKGEKKGNPG